MKICTFASGSSGNCALVWHKDTYILIDAGISMRRIVSCLQKLGLEARQLSSVLVTHEHSDHISGIPMLVKPFSLPVYTSGGTARALFKNGTIPIEQISVFETGRSFAIGDLQINSFETPHDTAESVGFTIDGGSRRLAFATDLGHVSVEVERAVMGAGTVILESNHDIEMLKCGRYPYRLKTRILGNRGHLSNDMGGQFASRLVRGGADKIMLAHLSRDNNTPDLAYNTVTDRLLTSGIRAGIDLALSVAPADVMSGILEV